MDEALTREPIADDAAQMQTAIEQFLTEIERLREQMSRDQIEIDRARTRTRILLADLKQANMKAA